MTIALVVAAVLLVLALLALVHRWLWIRLVRDTTAPGGRTRRAGTALAFALPLLALAALLAGRAGAPFWLQRTVSWPGYLWLAVLLYLTLAMLVAEAARAVWLRRRTAPAPAQEIPADEAAPAAGRAATASGAESAGSGTAPAATLAVPAGPAAAAGPVAPAPDGDGLSRRRFARTVAGAAGAAAIGTVGYGTYGVMRGPRVKRVQVPLAKLPRAAHGFRIAVVSDIHLGPVLGRAHTMRIVDTINRTQPDLIAVVGDLVDGSVDDLGSAAEPLRGLRARHGSYFVTGNHEYFSGAQQWVDHVRELGLTPLENARRALPYFDLAGVNDVQGESEGHGPDFAAALGDRDRARSSVLLAHQPVVIDEAVRHGVDLQLSGHTHGGQLWPGNYLAELANPTVAGLERYGDTQLYVSRGAGAWGPPVRVGAPSDITVVELASYQA
ncbi:metallophosphoesterase [Streptomyces sp. ISL-43]|uniref:metallophosphoesterase n=1 Tax=Streptomyces sp. ISL-43 TaxID=2819183 RepID=UPI001BEB8530|nr:metallophosphoesterase [Streptomyces sp. ISL-43]MBT2445756.1 metallophosphoesterase [Streptomyces sp. ISL-43]